MPKVKYLTRVDQVEAIPQEDRIWMKQVCARYKFRANTYYLSLIDWDDPDDPIRRIVIPERGELALWGRLDASNEADVTVMPGLEHKYRDTAVLLLNKVCGGYCRFCFRKRLFIDDNEEVVRDTTEQMAYIRAHPEITNVLLTGGDPLLLSTRRLRKVISALREIPQVRIIRIGSKMLAFNPYRVLDDPSLVELLDEYSKPKARIYLMAQYNHPRELTGEGLRAADTLMKVGVVMCNQSPIIHGVNDDVETLATLMRELSFVGITPYYFFQCRPTAGNKPYEVALTKAWRVFDRARRMVSGLAQRARFVMSHASGKVEMLAEDDDFTYLRYHRARKPADEGRFMVMERDDTAYWLDDLVEVDLRRRVQAAPVSRAPEEVDQELRAEADSYGISAQEAPSDEELLGTDCAFPPL